MIEKTASFVSTSGLQMEIVLKTKQAKNSQFDFLKYDHYLNPYYRHLIIMIKTGKYRPNVDNNSSTNNQKKKPNKNGKTSTNIFLSFDKFRFQVLIKTVAMMKTKQVIHIYIHYYEVGLIMTMVIQQKNPMKYYVHRLYQ